MNVCLFETVFFHALPPGMALPSGMNLSPASITTGMLTSGFRHAYLLGSFVCLLAVMASVLVKDRRRIDSSGREFPGAA